MSLQLSQRVQRIKPSATIAVSMKAAELRAQGHDIISLGAGEPDFDTPEHVKQAAIEAIEAGATKYTAVDGTPELKAAIGAKFKRDNDLDYEMDQILVSNGAKHSIYNLMLALLNPGDEVIVPSPYWVSYPAMVKLADAAPVIVATGAEQSFKLTPAQLEAAITKQTRLLVLNSPSNPSGMAYSREEWIALAAVLRNHPRVLVVSDEIYERIWWADEPYCNLVNAAPDLYERTVVVNGVSKAYAMTGWRIGYAAGPAALIKEMKKIQSQSTSNACSISQAAALAAISGDQGVVEPMVNAFKERHAYIVDALNGLPGVECLPGQGAFYAFPSFAGVMETLPELSDDIQLAGYLLDKAGVALVPGSAFGAPDYLRLSYATSMENLRRAIERLQGLLT